MQGADQRAPLQGQRVQIFQKIPRAKGQHVEPGDTPKAFLQPAQARHGAVSLRQVRAPAAEGHGAGRARPFKGLAQVFHEPVLKPAEIRMIGDVVGLEHDVSRVGPGKGPSQTRRVEGIDDADLGAHVRKRRQALGVAAEHAHLGPVFQQMPRRSIPRPTGCARNEIRRCLHTDTLPLRALPATVSCKPFSMRVSMPEK